MLLLPFHTKLINDWLAFKLRDVDLILHPLGRREPIAIFVASINSARELKYCFSEIGECVALVGVKGIVFRSDLPVMHKFAEKWHARSNKIPGHKPRYAIQNPDFDRWCVDLWRHYAESHRKN